MNQRIPVPAREDGRILSPTGYDPLQKNIRGPTLSAMVAAALLGVVSSSAWGMPTLTVVDRGNGQFEMSGQGLEGVGGVTMILEYDRAAYVNPGVTLGGLFSGALMAPNLSVPGIVRIGIISPNRLGLSGSGPVLTLSLTPVAGAVGSLSTFTAHLVAAVGGAEIPARTVITPLNDSSSTAAGTTNSSGTTTTTSTALSGSTVTPTTGSTGGTTLTTNGSGSSITSQGSGSVTGLGTVALSAGQRPGSPPETESKAVTMEQQGSPVAPPPAPEREPEGSDAPRLSAVASGAKAAPLHPAPAQKSVAELFREYTGERTLAALAKLFASGMAAGAHQEPAIALSDGSTTVTARVAVPPDVRSPLFTLSGAKLVALSHDDHFYHLELRPEKGTNGVKISIWDKDTVTVVPLVVAQPLVPSRIPGGLLNEKTVGLLLKDGKGNVPNGDGEAVWLDDYVLMANYLAVKSVSESKR